MSSEIKGSIDANADDDHSAFNPLSKVSLADSVFIALNKRTAYSLSKMPKITGSGIYALYYTGAFEPYGRLAQCNAHHRHRLPIYIGKADPPGKRKGAAGDELKTSTSLANRLRIHKRSIESASNLEIEDFAVRFLVVDVSFIGLCESLLIGRLTPLWNTTIDGLGNNPPGKGRTGQVQSRWDTLHPGRTWAKTLPMRSETFATICSEVKQVLRDNTLVSATLAECRAEGRGAD